jgi:hypothetical protein
VSKYVVQLPWSAAPHLDEAAKAELLKSIPLHQRGSRTEGRPQMGEGIVFPIDEDDIRVDPIKGGIPRHWPRAFGMDVGRRTAALWGALDPDTLILYLYDEYYRDGSEPSQHAGVIKSKGDWIRGVMDPSGNQSTAVDGQKFLQMYRNLGLNVTAAKNDVDPALAELLDLMMEGRIKAYSTLNKFWQEIRVYCRENGKIVKKDDEIMDCLRYLHRSGRARMGVKPGPPVRPHAAPSGDRAWMI